VFAACYNRDVDWVVVVHGGAGELDPARSQVQRDGCAAAARRAADLLAGGGTALAAVEAAVRQLEADPEFNAGLGAALTREGTVELDAAIAEAPPDGRVRVGAVGAVGGVRHAVTLARYVLEVGEHVLLVGAGAGAFARTLGIPPEATDALVTDRARERLARWRSQHTTIGGGTVGAVALDGRGVLAAATSTGGTTGKLPGRIGDTPVFGAGTYVDERAGACSATGPGEAILRVLVARDALDRIRAGTAAAEAAPRALEELHARTGAQAGLILIDAAGRPCIAHTTPSMAFALARSGAEIESGVVRS
jgi:beta-aspartyl-peptidase (threonine type)